MKPTTSHNGDGADNSPVPWTDHDNDMGRWIDRPMLAECVYAIFGAFFVTLVAGIQQKFIMGVEQLLIQNLIAPFVVGGIFGALIGYFVRGSRRPLLDSLEQERSSAIIRETANRDLEDQVSVSASNLETALDNLRYRNLVLEAQQNTSLEGILVVDRENKPISWNKRFLDMWEISEELIAKGDLTPIMNHTMEMVIDVEGFVRSINEFRENIDSTETLPGREFALKDGRIIEIISRTLLDQEGNSHGRVSFNRDVTEERKIESLKSEFISLASHELRTPLTSIFASIRLLLSGDIAPQLDDQSKKLLEISLRNCDRLLSLVDDILDMERIITGKMTYDFSPVDLVELITKSVEENEAYAHEYDVKLEFQAIDQPVNVSCDSERIIQVMSNLISNAAKFSPKGETVSIIVEPMTDEVRVSVIDRGEGVPAGFDHQIFEKFTQAENLNTRTKGGSGLGLSISKSIINQHGGMIDFNSEEGDGATFYFELPLI